MTSSHTLVSVEEVSLYDYPKKEERELKPGEEITLGDLHGNALKLVQTLIRENILNMSEEDYEAFVNIYTKKPDALTSQHLDKFRDILARSSINEKATQNLIRLIGDELSDRGSNDYFTLKILEMMGKANVPCEILLSNHSIEFLKCYDEGLENFKPKLGAGQGISLENLGLLIEKGLVTRKEITDIVENYYKPKLKIVSCSIDDSEIPPSITIYSHAPVGIRTLAMLAKMFEVDFPQEVIPHVEDEKKHDKEEEQSYSDDDDSDDENVPDILKLISSFADINEEFQDILNNKKIYSKAFDELEGPKAKASIVHALARILWARRDLDQEAKEPPELRDIRILALPDGTKVYFVHGHDSKTAASELHVICIDNLYGKFRGDPFGNYCVLRSRGTPLAATKKKDFKDEAKAASQLTDSRIMVTIGGLARSQIDAAAAEGLAAPALPPATPNSFDPASAIGLSRSAPEPARKPGLTDGTQVSS
ncbi:MAG: hypothetical protein ACYCQI_06740 [Gammaproteobacteria bacterium]